MNEISEKGTNQENKNSEVQISNKNIPKSKDESNRV